MRTSARCIEFAETALNDDSPHMGVKGPCASPKLMPDFVVGSAIDQMHCVFSGVVKKLLSLWFDSSHKNELHSLADTADVINDRLIKIKPSSFVHRMPRSTEDLIHWKASELKNWFFYYSLPVMNGIMQREYLDNFSMLIAGIALLNSDSITNADVNRASNFLHMFVREFEILYGLKNCSINGHLIIHLSQSVLAFGPLRTNDCFRQEDLNGQYFNVIKGTRHIDSQIVRSHNQQLKLHRFFEQLPDGRIKYFCFKRKHNNKIGEQLEDGCYTIGSYKTYNERYEIPEGVQQALANLLPMQNIQEYFRLLKDSKLYVSERYTRATQMSSLYTLYRDQTGYHLGLIICFVKIHYYQCLLPDNFLNHCAPVHRAIIQTLFSEKVFNVIGDNDVRYGISYIYKCTRMENFISVSIDQLITVCFEIKINDQLYIAMPVNSNNTE